MNTIIDYLDWRGDLSFGQSEFNEVDNLILAQTSYLNLGVLKGQARMEDIGKRYKKIIQRRNENPEKYVSEFTARVEYMFLKAAKSRRFKDVLITDFINKFDEVRESQFSAMTFLIDSDLMYVAYRGTDDTIVGFKENLNMSFSAPVPGQIDAVQYLKHIIKKFSDRDVIVGGHSKGGNFAVYATSGLTDEERKRIKCVYNNDGPGFTENILKSEGYIKTAGIVRKYLPKDSLVGILMDDEEEYTVINASGASGILQHDGLNWEVKGTEFVRKEDFSKKSKFIDKTIKHWLYGLDRKERELFVDELYDIVRVSMNAKRLNDLSENRIKMTYSFFRRMGDLDRDKREMIQNTVLKLIQSGSEVKKAEKEIRKKKKTNEKQKKESLKRKFSKKTGVKKFFIKKDK